MHPDSTPRRRRRRAPLVDDHRAPALSAKDACAELAVRLHEPDRVPERFLVSDARELLLGHPARFQQGEPLLLTAHPAASPHVATKFLAYAQVLLHEARVHRLQHIGQDEGGGFSAKTKGPNLRFMMSLREGSLHIRCT